jgi:hypothetical protein
MPVAHHSEIANVGIAKCPVLNLQRKVKDDAGKVRVEWRRRRTRLPAREQIEDRS